MNDSFYMSVTMSNKEAEIIKKALTMLKNEVILHPKKHWEVNHNEISNLIYLIDDKKRWGVPYSIDNDKDSE